jgi:hypothetical protein
MSKKNIAQEKLMNAFEEELNDKELQERYDRFRENEKREKERYNNQVPVVNELIKRVNDLQHVVLESAVLGILAIESIEELKKLRIELEEAKKIADGFRAAMEYQKDLAEKYEDYSDRKLFHWWKSLKAVGIEVMAWGDWKRQYENVII